MNYNHLTIEERCCIRKYYNEGKSFREIAILIGRNVSTISREIWRNKSFMNCKPAYYPQTAQRKYSLRRKFCHRGMFWKRENLDYIEDKLKCEVYFADPYCAWQKGTNENSNGLLREFYPKGRNLSHVGEKTLKKNLALINARPKKVLGYKAPADLFEQELQKVLHLV